MPPLFVPAPGERPAPAAAGCAGQCDLGADLRVLHDTLTAGRPAAMHAPADPDARASYRWRIGHHVSVVLWQLMSGELIRALAMQESDDNAIELTVGWYDLYSVVLLYTGSCSASRYGATVRADMAAWNPALSGEWAADHRPLPGLVHEILQSRPSACTAPLRAAVHDNQHIHAAVAARLVPDGVSLLQEAGRQPGATPDPLETAAFDAYFAVRRSPVCDVGLRAQLVRRLVQVVCDLVGHGLHDVDERWLTEEGQDSLVEKFSSLLLELLCHHIEHLAAQEVVPGCGPFRQRREST
ncbi:hypothetical protein [Streptomyces luteolus]|uniref:Uncharacterized protein n=1 Tax=Streptomyces luteolus TaxID=3043615 RepID=A0ABT6T7Y2_9ACTN|nr:hypothetical protein [Streptomyces sp. B-S-A12]MDI3424008.1 hypothetical protein [Streptomyces sp. B-S-A12]